MGPLGATKINNHKKVDDSKDKTHEYKYFTNKCEHI